MIFLSFQAFRYGSHGAGDGDINMDNVECEGNEHTLLDCPYAGWQNHNCRHSEDAAVKCFNSTG